MTDCVANKLKYITEMILMLAIDIKRSIDVNE